MAKDTSAPAEWSRGDGEVTGVPDGATETERRQEELRALHASQDAAAAEKEEAEPTTPFVLTIYFANGLVREIEVTSIDYQAAHGRIVDASWTQNHVVPGEPLLAYLDWSQVLMVETATIEPRAMGRKRR